MAVKLHTVNALVTANKQPAERTLTETYHVFQKAEPLSGVDRHYQPVNDEGETLPPEVKRVQVNASDTIAGLSAEVGKMFDLQFSQDRGNTVARADVEVDGVVILADVPVTYLLWLDKQLTNLRTLFIGRLPELDPAATWHWDSDRNCYVSDPVVTHRTTKIPARIVKWEPPTPEYTQPAQVDTYLEDVRVGQWTTVKLSGALPAARIREFRDRVGKLIDAVKVAREQANSAEVVIATNIGSSVFSYLFR